MSLIQLAELEKRIDQLKRDMEKWKARRRIVRGGGMTQHDQLYNLLMDGHPQYALADKSRPSPWVAETDVPVLANTKYPNALLLDGSRQMTGSLNVWGASQADKSIIWGTENVSLRANNYTLYVQRRTSESYANLVARTIASTLRMHANQMESYTGSIIAFRSDLKANTDSLGVILIDRDDATLYRLYVDAGSLLIEAV